MADQWLCDIDRKMTLDAVLLNFSNAFHLTEQEMSMKLAAYGFNLSAHSWVRCHLSNRTQNMYFHGSLSSERMVQYGVLQGSCLGPLLYCMLYE